MSSINRELGTEENMHSGILGWATLMGEYAIKQSWQDHLLHRHWTFCDNPAGRKGCYFSEYHILRRHNITW